MLKNKAKRLFPLGKLSIFAIPFPHSCIAALDGCACAAFTPSWVQQRNTKRFEYRKTRHDMAYMNTSTAASFGLMDRIAGVMKSAKEALNKRRVYNQTVSELRALSTRELNDLGISRSMITRIALEAAYGKNI
jgi:uncharacterized protein YjiS (DUF1127 family)